MKKKRSKIWFVLGFLILLAGGGIYYRLKIYDPWQDASWISRQVVAITSQTDAQALSPEQEAFLKDFLKRPVLKTPHVGLLFNWVQDRQPELVAQYAKLYSEVGFPSHTEPQDAEELADLGGKLLKSNSFTLAGQFFEQATQLGISQGNEVIALWSFFAGYGFEQGGQVDQAIELYKKSLSLNEEDYRASRQLGLVYFNKAKANLEDHFSRTLARKYLTLSLRKNKQQADLQQTLMDLIEMETQNLMNLNPQSPFSQYQPFMPPGVNIPNPIPPIPQPGIQTPHPGQPRILRPGFKGQLGVR